MPLERIGLISLVVALRLVVPAHAGLAWPDLCARREVAGERQPDEVGVIACC